MRIIKKKIWPEYFDLIASGKKKYELRLADFEVAEGDVLRLEEWNPGTKQYTGRAQDVTITMVRKTKDQQFWSADDVQRYGFQIIQIEPVQDLPRGVEVVVGVVIRNQTGEILLTKSKKWSRPVIPGGHVEPGESILEAAKREGEEETGLRLKPIAVLRWGEQIKPKEYHRPAHWIFFHCLCEVIGGEVRLQSSELTDYSWVKPEALAKKGMYRETMEQYQFYVAHQRDAVVIPSGRYEHYKGEQYEVVGIAENRESHEQLVVYRALYGNFGLYVRPLSMFTEQVEVNGKKVPRFRFVGE